MIKGLLGTGGVTVMGGNTSVPYINMNSETPMQGMIRVWGTDIQVFNGSNWTVIPSSYATVQLDPTSQEIISWVKKKMVEEEFLLTLPSDNTAVKLAKKNINRIKQELARAEEQLKITEILSQDE